MKDRCCSINSLFLAAKPGLVFHEAGEHMDESRIAKTEQARLRSALSSDRIELISSKEPIFVAGEGVGDSVPVARA